MGMQPPDNYVELVGSLDGDGRGALKWSQGQSPCLVGSGTKPIQKLTA